MKDEETSLNAANNHQQQEAARRQAQETIQCAKQEEARRVAAEEQARLHFEENQRLLAEYEEHQHRAAAFEESQRRVAEEEELRCRDNSCLLSENNAASAAEVLGSVAMDGIDVYLPSCVMNAEERARHHVPKRKEISRPNEIQVPAEVANNEPTAAAMNNLSEQQLRVEQDDSVLMEGRADVWVNAEEEAVMEDGSEVEDKDRDEDKDEDKIEDKDDSDYDGDGVSLGSLTI